MVEYIVWPPTGGICKAQRDRQMLQGTNGDEWQEAYLVKITHKNKRANQETLDFSVPLHDMAQCDCRHQRHLVYEGYDWRPVLKGAPDLGCKYPGL